MSRNLYSYPIDLTKYLTAPGKLISSSCTWANLDGLPHQQGLHLDMVRKLLEDIVQEESLSTVTATKHPTLGDLTTIELSLVVTNAKAYRAHMLKIIQLAMESSGSYQELVRRMDAEFGRGRF